MRLLRAMKAPIALLLASVAVACVIVSRSQYEAVPLSRERIAVSSAVKAHLRDGSIVAFQSGVSVWGDSMRGTGTRYSPTLERVGVVSAIPIDSIVGAESFERGTDFAKTFGASVATTLGLKGLVTMALTNGEINPLKAIFGSCPTIYSDSAGSARLEAESFSYSIAPLLEKRDVDRLAAQPDANGRIRLEVRNEALETHFIDQLELLELRHAAHEELFPAPRGSPVALSSFLTRTPARDRSGRDVSELLARPDNRWFATDSGRLARAATSASDHDDWIDVTVPRLGSDSIAVALRMRSSLLTTVLFYDYMLARPGARSLDWTAHDLGRITTLASLARWYTGAMGLRVHVWDGDDWRQVARLADFGPIAWRNVAVVVPALETDSVRVRLTFTADEWRIDRLSVATRLRRVEPRRLAPTFVTTTQGDRPAVVDLLARPDERRLVTSPGHRFFVDFHPGASAGTERRTFLIAAHGYYNEWVRGEWLRSPKDSTAFDPKRVRLQDVLGTWRAVKDSMEAQFFISKVPVV